MRHLSVTSTGAIHNHGPHERPCAGSGCAPVNGLLSTQSQLAPALTAHDNTHVPLQPVDSSQQAQLLLNTLIDAHSPVLKYIPKASRLPAASKLSILLDCVVACPDNIGAWQQWLLFTYGCFNMVERGGQRHRTSLATKFNRITLSDYLTTSHQPQSAAVAFSSKRKKKLATPNDLGKLAARVSAKIEEGDVRGAVRMANSDDTLAPFDDATAAELRQLHPQRASSTIS